MMDTMTEMEEKAWGPLTARYIWKLEADCAMFHDQRDQLLAAAQAVIQWTETPESKPTGGFIHFAEVIVPALVEAIAAATGQG